VTVSDETNKSDRREKRAQEWICMITAIKHNSRDYVWQRVTTRTNGLQGGKCNQMRPGSHLA